MRRLDQLLANLGYCSRRGARDFLKNHVVTDGRASGASPGGRCIDTSQKVDPALVRVDGEPLDHPDGLLLMLNKPAGLVCSHDAREGPSVYDLLSPRWRERNPQVTSVGRLDKDTSGLLLLTDLTPLVHRLTSPRHHVPKRYRATVDRDLSNDLVPIFASGTLQLEGEKQPCAPATLQLVSPREAVVILTEGRYHQVRRMFAAAAGATVLALHREQFGDLALDGLPLGKWRELPLGFFDQKEER